MIKLFLLLIALSVTPCLNFGQETSSGSQYNSNNDTTLAGHIPLTFNSHKKFEREDFKKGIVFSPLQMIQGKVPGLAIMNITGNDQNPYLQSHLRGASTMFFETDPTYVVNGIPIANADFIMPENIESIEVVDNLSETASYGLRGCNGIISINTLKKNREKFALTYSNWFFTEMISKKSDYLSPSEVRELKSLWGSMTPDNVNQMAVFYINDVKDFDSSTDWLKKITQNRISQMHNIALNGIHKNLEYSLSLSFRDYYGIIKRNGSDNTSGQFSISQSLFKKKIIVNLNSIWSVRNFSDYNTNPYLKNKYLSSSPNIFVYASRFNPTMAVYDENGEYTSYYVGLSLYQNPLSRLFNTEDSRKTRNFLASLGIEYKIIDGLKLSASFARLDLDKNFYYSQTYSTIKGTNLDDSNETRNNDQFYLKAQLNFTKTIHDHNINFLMSYSHEKLQYEESITHQNSSNGSYGIFPDVISQLLVKADYSFKNKYLMSAGFLSERSKLFPVSDPSSHSFPSIKAGWVLSNEKFLRNLKFIDYLEIYSKYGQSRRNVNLYNYYDRGLLKDEILKENVVGMNLILINKKVSFLLERYSKITNDGIWAESVSFSNQIFNSNAMEIRNRGWEFSTRLNNISRKKFQWTSDLNISINENKVLTDLITNSLVDRYGQSVGTIIGNRFARFSSANSMLVYDVTGNEVPYPESEYLKNSIPKLYFGITNSFVFKNFDFTILLRGAAGHYIQNVYKYDLPHGGYNIKKNITSVDMRFLLYGETRLNMDYLLEKGSFVKADNVMLGYTINPHLWKIKKLRFYIACNNLATFTKFTGWDPEMVPISGTYIGKYNVDLYPVTRIYSAGLKIEI